MFRHFLPEKNKSFRPIFDFESLVRGVSFTYVGLSASVGCPGAVLRASAPAARSPRSLCGAFKAS